MPLRNRRSTIADGRVSSLIARSVRRAFVSGAAGRNAARIAPGTGVATNGDHGKRDDRGPCREKPDDADPTPPPRRQTRRAFPRRPHHEPSAGETPAGRRRESSCGPPGSSASVTVCALRPAGSMLRTWVRPPTRRLNEVRTASTIGFGATRHRNWPGSVEDSGHSLHRGSLRTARGRVMTARETLDDLVVWRVVRRNDVPAVPCPATQNPRGIDSGSHRRLGLGPTEDTRTAGNIEGTLGFRGVSVLTRP